MSYIIKGGEEQGGDLRSSVVRIFESGLEAIDMERIIPRKIHVEGNSFSVEGDDHIYDTQDFHRVIIVGIGKGARGVVSLFCKHVKGVNEAYALDVEGYASSIPTHEMVKVYEGTHPHPSDINVAATQHIISSLKTCSEDDLVIFLVLGGGSSLLCGDEDEKTVGSRLFTTLTNKGASIREINIVRKHLSSVKGGGLAAAAYPATTLSLIVSDVCGNDLGTIASGPTVFDASTKEDALAILEAYGCSEESVYIKETVKDTSIFERSRALLLVCNEDALLPMLERARKEGFHAKIISTAFQGEASQILAPYLSSIRPGEVYIFGGESSVSGCIAGEGGRNQEVVLGALYELSKHSFDGEICIGSIASDGKDNVPVAGALMCSGEIVDADYSYLKDHNSYQFFKKYGGHVLIQQRCLNVSDLIVVARR